MALATAANAKLSGGDEAPASREAAMADKDVLAERDSAKAADSQAEAAAEAALEEKLRAVVAEKRMIEHEQVETAPLVCRDERKLGSRIKKHRCLTLAQWREEYEMRLFKSYLMAPGGSPRGWQVPGSL